MMHERNFTLLFNLNGYESTATESFFLSIGEQSAQEMARKNLLDIVTMEMRIRRQEVRQREAHTYQKKKQERKKCESMLLEIYISFNRLTPETWRSRYRHPLYDCRSFVS